MPSPITPVVSGTFHRLFLDEFVVYACETEAGQFVAHSLLTDQIGVEEDVEGAVYELFKAIRTLLDEANRSENVEVFRAAPDEVYSRFQEARADPRAKLPDALLQRVQKRLGSAMRATEYWELDIEGSVEDFESVDLSRGSGSRSALWAVYDRHHLGEPVVTLG